MAGAGGVMETGVGSGVTVSGLVIGAGRPSWSCSPCCGVGMAAGATGAGGALAMTRGSLYARACDESLLSLSDEVDGAE